MTPTPKDQLLTRVSTWCGIQIHPEEITRLTVKGRTIARFPTHDSLEAAVCGKIQQKLVDEPEIFPDGIWENNKAEHIIVDLRLPGGIEEGVRVLLNTYMQSQTAQPTEKWWMEDEFLKGDPKAQQVLGVISGYRAKLNFVPN
jgi:hypothetical protein